MIFDIEEFAVYDGPGIRTTVFFKGCPLNCIWCHNPEGISKKQELMIKHKLCSGCGQCMEVCPFNMEKCTACGACVAECPVHIRKICGIEITAHELSEKVKKNNDFYHEDNGGITISGGEPFYQPEFLFAVLHELIDFHRAVETSGHTSSDLFKKAFNFVDLFIMDIKHTDSSVHKAVTGAENKTILENFHLLKESGKPFIARIPLIPGINDSNENLSATANLLAGSKNLIRVELLPYNKLAKTKYSSLGKIYHPPFDETRKPNTNQEHFKRVGIESIIL